MRTLTEREASYESSGYSGDPKSDSVRILDGGKFAGLQMEFKKRTLMFKMVFLAAILSQTIENLTNCPVFQWYHHLKTYCQKVCLLSFRFLKNRL